MLCIKHMFVLYKHSPNFLSLLQKWRKKKKKKKKKMPQQKGSIRKQCKPANSHVTFFC